MVGYPDEGKILKAAKRGFEWADSPRKDIIIKLKKARQSRKPVIFAGIAAFILLIALTSASPMSSAVMQTTTESYIDHEPRSFTTSANVTEFYQVPQKFKGGSPCVYKPYEFEQDFHYSMEIVNTSIFLRCVVEIKNFEQKVGEWKYYLLIHKHDGREYETSAIAKNISGNTTEEFTWMIELDSLTSQDCRPKAESLPSQWKCDADVIALEEEERTSEKKKTVTVIVDVERTRNITKEVNQTVYVNRLFGYNQPFWLGY